MVCIWKESPLSGWGGVFLGGQLLCKNICTVSTWKASHRYESACDFSGDRHSWLSSCIGCSCVSFSNQLGPWCWNLLSLPQLAYPWFGFVFSVSQQGLIANDKIYVVMRKSFKKAKVKAQWLLQTIQELLCSTLWLTFFNRLMFNQNK